jgi:hypothetical protein
VNQLTNEVLPLMVQLHPRDTHRIVFAFDNSQNHHAMKPDALVANRMNLSDGGKTAYNMRETSFINSKGEKKVQKMQFDNGVAKGIKTILQERGLWPSDRRRFLLKCKNPDCLQGVKDCCATTLLDNQPDFCEQVEWLRETVEAAGHEIIFFPKFHCELNFIEMVWAFVKAYYRRHCQFDFKKLREMIDTIMLEKVTKVFVRRAARHCYRFMDGYRRGMKGPLLDYAIKKYSRHRSIPTTVQIAEINEEYEKKRDEKFNKHK